MYTLVEKMTYSIMKATGAKSHYTSEGIHYMVKEGTGDRGTLVLLHGITGNAVDVYGVVPFLKSHFNKIIMPEAPGHGKSITPKEGMNPDAINVLFAGAMKNVLEDKCVVFGNSLGGLAALKLCNMYPDKIRAGLLCSPGGAPMTEEELQEFLDVFRVGSREESYVLMDKLFVKRPFPAPLMNWFISKRFNQPSVVELVNSVNAGDLLTEDEMRNVKVPLAVIWGQKDLLHTGEFLSRFKKHLPESTVYIEPHNLGHIPATEHPKELAMHMLEALNILENK